jgi:integrase/recombinase XerC
VAFSEQNNVTRLCDVNKTICSLFFLQLEESNNAVSVRDYHKIIKRFFNYLIWNDVIEKSPMIKIELPKVERKIKQPLPLDYIKRMVEVCPPHLTYGLRNRAILLTFLETGVRRSELIKIKLQDIDVVKGLIKIMGKGAKERVVGISNITQKAIYLYLKKRQQKSDYLFIYVNSLQSEDFIQTLKKHSIVDDMNL